MKTKLLLQTPAAIFILIAALAASAQPAPRIDPATGLPIRAGMPTPVLNPANGLPVQTPAPVPTVDPTTGLPIAATAEPQWIDPSWPDPPIVLTNVNYDGLPLSEVAHDLRQRFQNYFDILPMPHTFDQDWGSAINIQLQLKDVKASDVFSAMNLVFENDRTPARWELKAVGNRPLVQLRVLPEAAPRPGPSSSKPAETHRMVYFVGNLLGDEKSGGMTMNQIIKTISEVWPAEFGKPDGVIQFHTEAQMLVVNGTREQLDLIQQTLTALRQKVELEHVKQVSADANSPMGRLLNQRIQELKSTGGGSQ